MDDIYIKKAEHLSEELENFRRRRIVTLLDRTIYFYHNNYWSQIGNDFNQIKDDALLFYLTSRKFRLNYSQNLQNSTSTYFFRNEVIIPIYGLLIGLNSNLPIIDSKMSFELQDCNRNPICDMNIFLSQLDDEKPLEIRFDEPIILKKEEVRISFSFSNCNTPIRIMEIQCRNAFLKISKIPFLGFITSNN